ncbi:MAG: adenylate/guanylate cyclase domain-containing protein, partial [Bacteroidota bacterium]
GKVFTRYEILSNRPECWRCHDKSEPIRGVIQVALKPETANMAKSDASVRQMAGTMGNAIATAFRTIMLGGNGEQMDTLMASAREIPSIDKVQVYNREGSLHFGPDDVELPEGKITPLTKVKNHDQRFEPLGKKLRLFIPLENEDRCQVCHGQKFPMRGVMVIDFNVDTLEKFLGDPEKLFTWALENTIFQGFRSIMLVGRANSVRFYMDELRAQSVLHTLRAYDKNGNERFLNPPPRSRKEIKSVLEKQDTLEFIEKVGDEESMVRISALPNQNRCHACHGSTHKVRAVVEVSSSMKTINAEIRANKIQSAGVGGLTILLVWVVIRFFMKGVVVRPVQIIERVASRVGQGDFSAQADVHSRDEIGSLATKINEMVHGLRERFHLEKFVSRQTVDAIRRSDIEGVKLGGERKLATVFFSDIRGFTAYSEKVEPERVVSMLNRCLSHQAKVVKKHGGDIDKYVGDEMVAVFVGEDMVERAIRTALEIQAGIDELNDDQSRDIINIGIGINTGEMVMGAMGSAERMDYTVIGDNVNLGARLCGAAKARQILVSEFSAEHVLGKSEFHLAPLDPIMVKGKQDPVRVYEVK